MTIGASVGVAVDRDGGTDAETLLHEADSAAYRAKAAGRGRVEVFDDALRCELGERAALEGAIRDGLVAGEFLLEHPPLVDAVTGALRGHAALLRWDRPGHGLVAPDRFLPTAERSTLVCDLGRWALGEATRHFAGWLAARPDERDGPAGPLAVAVEVSRRHVASAGIVADVEAALRAAGLGAEHLVLEITEDALLDEPATGPHLLALRARGVRISVDGYGAGWTSSGRVLRRHVDAVRIDGSLLASDEPGAEEVVELLVRVARASGLDVVVEGPGHEERSAAPRTSRLGPQEHASALRPAERVLAAAPHESASGR